MSEKTIQATPAETDHRPSALRYPHIIPDIRQWPIVRFAARRGEFINELRTHARLQILRKHEDDLIEVLQKTAYLERIRLRVQRWKVDPPNEMMFWKRIEKRLLEILELEPESRMIALLPLLDKIILRYANEIVGGFQIRTFKLARIIVPLFLKGLYNSIHDYKWGILPTDRANLLGKIRIVGEFELLREIFPKGVVVFVPTHFSHLDSVLLGYAIDQKAGLPAFLYGAGLNLFESEIFAYFMNRLGAYRVDRRKKNTIYRETLKSFSNLAVQWGVNSLFFPGGTRSRNGAIERQLKLGLLNSLVQAQREIYQKGQSTKVIVVPIVLNYHFVLEAGPLIREYLRRLGAERSLTRSPKVMTVKNILRFVSRIIRKHSEVSISFGHPIDVLGNPLDTQLNSLDHKGHPIDLEKYFYRNGRITVDDQREKIYTRQLADAIVNSYHRYQEVLSSHLVAFAAFHQLKEKHPNYDLFDLIRLDERDYVFDEEQLLHKVQHYLKHLHQLATAKKIFLSPKLQHATPHEVLNDGIYHLGAYHMRRPLRRDGKGRIISEDFKKLFYYHNRLDQPQLWENDFP